MGVLDDAIREHLDLKRRRGADPTEIERLEREALGPVRREPTPFSELAGQTAQVGVAEPGFDGPDYEGPAHHAPPTDTVAKSEQRPSKRRSFLHRRTAPSRDLDRTNDEPETQLHQELDLPEQADRGEPEPPPLTLDGLHDEAPPTTAAETVHKRPMDEDTVEHEAAHGFDDDDEYRAFEDEPEVAEDKDDVLEETPEFLQDTPDHDRLWFEQRPPKDFDFDG
jgi:hypothetical protein